MTALPLLLVALLLDVRRVEPHGEGAYGLKDGGKSLALKQLSIEKKEDWLGKHFRPSFALPPRPDLRAGLSRAPAYPDLGSAVMLREDGRGVLVVYDRPDSVPAIDDIYDTHHRYTVLYQVVRAIEGKSPPAGRPEWVLDLEGLYPGVLEMSDLWLDGDRLFVNIGINGYAKVLGGKTAYVACIDAPEATLLWRTGPLVSNGPLLLLPDHLVTGYGFTAEPDHLHVIDKASGAIVQKVALPNAMEDLALQDGKLYVKTYDRYAVFSVPGE